MFSGKFEGFIARELGFLERTYFFNPPLRALCVLLLFFF